jgi:PAS domain S-box-containing protein
VQDAVLVIQDGRLAYANPVLATMMGEASSTLLGLGVQQLVPPAYRRELWEQYCRWESGQVTEAFETRLSTRNGEAILVSVRAGAMEMEGRRAIVATVRDLSRERRLEREIKDHAGSLAAINEIANAVNLDLTIEDVFGVAAEEARRLAPFDRLSIALLDDAGDGLEVVAVGGGDAAAARGLPARGRAVGLPAAVRVVRDRQGAAASARGGRAARRRDPLGAGPAPAVEGPAGGVPHPRAPGRRGLLPGRPGRARAVARHVAIAIDNARLLEDVRRRSREFESLLEIGRHVVERRALAELLPLVTQSVNRVMGTGPLHPEPALRGPAGGHREPGHGAGGHRRFQGAQGRREPDRTGDVGGTAGRLAGHAGGPQGHVP